MNTLSQIIRSRLFWFGLILKIFLSIFFASKFLTDLFLPFVDFYVNNLNTNPYDHFFLEEKNNIFPYPSLMLWILSFPYLLYVSFGKISVFLSIFVLRIPILIADFFILLILSQWLKQRIREVLIFYWLSPILIYISYVHGQLDAISIAFLFASLHFLFREKFITTAILLAAAISCKTHIIIVVPLFLIYLFSRHLKLSKILQFILITLATFSFLNVFLFSTGFLEIVLLNQQQSKIFDSFHKFGDSLLLFFVPASYLILLARALSIKGYNRDIFIMFLGFSFTLINIFIPPMHGWYYWIIPFLAYFYIKQEKSPKHLFVLLQIFYLAYFATIKDSDFLQIFQLVSLKISTLSNIYNIFGDKSDTIVSLLFTALQTTLLLNCFWIYRDGISRYLKYKLISKPYL